MKLREAAQQALAALELLDRVMQRSPRTDEAIQALRAALEEPVQEPVAIVGTREGTWKGYEGQWLPPGPPIKTVHMLRDLPQGTPLYTAPPQRKPLTEAQIYAAIKSIDSLKAVEVARAIERAHGIE